MKNVCIEACMENEAFIEIVENEENRMLLCRIGCNGFQPLEEETETNE